RAGASCAIGRAGLGVAPLLVEAGPRLGGLATDSPFADDWIAVLPGVTGQQVAANIAASVQAAGVPARLGTAVRHARRVSGGFDRKSTRLNSSHVKITYAVFSLKKKTMKTASIRLIS